MGKYLFSKQDVEQIFDSIKEDALKALAKGQLNKAATLIEMAAKWGYQYNYKYADYDLEQAMQQIARRMGPDYQDYVGTDNKVVFICNRMADNCELTQQYARALSYRKIPYLMVVVDRKCSAGYANILDELKQDPYATVEFVEDKSDLLGTALEIAEKVVAFRPTKILNHAWPWDIRIWLAIAKLRKLPNYNICFNDHSFWIGASLLDYNIEFRSYGAKIAVEKRGLKAEQLYHLPFYPILSKNIPFQGFPNGTEGKIIFFGGGSFYKMMGGNGRFFKNMDRILGENQNAVFVLATGGARQISQELAKLKNNDRIFLTGFRRDIYAMFANCDIYYSTYPLVGGLMSQYAAALKKPIVAFFEKRKAFCDIEGILCYHKKLEITYDTDDSLCAYAHKLCEDKAYREQAGRLLNEVTITESQFNEALCRILDGNKSADKFDDVELDYPKIRQFYYDFNNHFPASSVALLWHTYGLKIIYKYPRCVVEAAKLAWQKVVKRIKRG